MKTAFRGAALAAIVCFAPAGPATAQPAADPISRPAPSARLGRELGGAGWISTAILAVGLGVIVAMAAAARKYAPVPGAHQARLVSRLGLGPKHSVYIVRVGRRAWLLGAGPQGAPAVLAELDPVDDDPVGKTPPPTPEDQA